MRLAHSLAIGSMSVAVVVAALRLTPLAGSAAIASGDEADKVEAPKIAVCAIPMLVNELMQSDRFKPDREKLEEELKSGYEELQNQLKEIAEKGRSMKPEDPGAQDLLKQFQGLQQKLGQMQSEIAQKLEAKSAEQLLACYELARTSASAVAEELGYNYVMASVGNEEKLSGDNVEIALRQMMARPVVMSPKNADITEDVRADLKL